MRKYQRIKRAARIVSIVLCLVSFASADDKYNVYGDMAAEVLVSPRSGALASSDMALNAAGPLASNPALTALPVPPELTLGYSSYYGDIFSSSMLTYFGRVGERGGIGATVAYLLIPGIEYYPEDTDITALDPDNAEIFTASDVWTRVSYSHSFSTAVADLYAGAAVTARRRRLETLSAYGIGADLGIMAHFKEPSLYAALMWENVRYSIVRWQSSDYTERVPQHLRASLAWERDDPYIYGRIALYYTTPDLLFNEGINSQGETNDREESREPEIDKSFGALFTAARYGVEYTIMNTLTLRAGMHNDGYTMGAGVALFRGRAGIDFCYVTHELAGSVKMSITYRWH